MVYTCAVCWDKVDGDIVTFQNHTNDHIIELVKKDHPEWIEKDGICKKCFDYYESEIKGSPLKTANCALRQRKVKGFSGWLKGLFTK